MSAMAGRVAETARLRAQLARVTTDRTGEAVLVEGEPGIGKSRLLVELADLARDAGYRVLTARADEWESDIPYAVLAEAFRPVLAESPVTDSGWGTREEQGLAAVFPELADSDAAALVPDRRYLVHRALGSLLDRLAEDRGCLLVVDDAHWADAAAVDALGGLLRRRTRSPVLVALGCRGGQLPTQLGSALAAATQDGRAEHLTLSPLSRTDAAALLEGPDDDRRLDRLYELSGGNPFYLEQLDRAEGSASSTAVGKPSVPAAVRSSLSAELATLTPWSREVLETAAVAGDPFDLDLLEAVAEPDVLDALDELVRGGWVRSTEVPRRFSFRHPLVRSAVYESAGGGWRIRAHGRLVATLTERGAPAAVLAQHLEHVARAGDGTAVATFAEAGDDALARAPITATRWYDAALRTLPSGPDSEQRRIELELARAVALGNAGRVDDALVQIDEVLARIPAEEALLRARLAFECARIEVLTGRPEDAEVRCEAALENLGDVVHAHVVRLWQVSASAKLAQHRFADGRREGEHALALLAQLDEPALEADAHATLALSHVSEGRDLVTAGAHLDRAVAALARATPVQVAEYAESVYVLSWVSIILGRWADALSHVDRALQAAVDHGVPRALVPLMVARGEALLWLGQVSESLDAAEEAVEAARATGNAQFTYWALWTHARALLWVGRTDEALRVAEESLELSAGRPKNYLSDAEPEWQAGTVFLAVGQVERAKEVLLRGFGGPEAPRVVFVDRVLAWENLLDIALAEGNLAEARGYIDRMASALTHQHGPPVLRAAVARGRAAVALAAGEGLAEARAELDEVIAHFEASDAVLELGSTLLESGRLHARQGTRDQAIADLARAEVIFAGVGAEGGRAACAQELRKLGRRSGTAKRAGGSGTTGLASLTGREREVAELVANGETNRSVGKLLFLSEKTVEAHLRNVFVKLGITSRAAVARALQRE